MRRFLRTSLLIGITLSLVRCGPSAPARPSAATLVARTAAGQRLLEATPTAFVPNVGQWDHSASYVARFGPMTAFFAATGWTCVLEDWRRDRRDEPAWRGDRRACDAGAIGARHGRGVAVRMAFAGAGEPTIHGERELPGRHHYFLGSDASRWRTDVPTYGALLYRSMYPGIDVRVRPESGRLEFDLILAPEAAVEQVEVEVAGVDGMRLLAAGELVLDTALGQVCLPVPTTWEAGPTGETTPLACRYVLRGTNRFGFVVPERRAGWQLTIDPGLVWSTLIGSNRVDEIHAVAIDQATGEAVVAGTTDGPGFPTTVGAYERTYRGGFGDAFLVRFAATGSSLVYSTFFGGGLFDSIRALALDDAGAPTVAGYTSSGDLPTTPGAYSRTHGGGVIDTFVARFSADGGGLSYSTYLGGTDSEFPTALALEAQGSATVVGYTRSADFPTTPGAFDRSFNGGVEDGYVTRLSPTGGSLVYSTFLGGSGDLEDPRAVVVDAQGVATVAGLTMSSDFPTTAGAFRETYGGGPTDAYVVRLDPAGAALRFATFLGDTGRDAAFDVEVDASGEATVAGYTESAAFPTTPGVFDRTFNGVWDAFVARLVADGSALVYSTFLGGAGLDAANALAVDSQGAVTLAGLAGSADFPTTPGAFSRIPSDLTDVFVARLSPSASRLYYSSYLGGDFVDDAKGLVLDGAGHATVAGYTMSSNFPTTPGAYQRTAIGKEGFVTRMDLLPRGVAAFGTSSSGCAGPLPSSVTSMPSIGNSVFSVTCGNAPPNGGGLAAFCVNRYSAPLRVLGIDVWVDVAAGIFLPAASNGAGGSEVVVPVPADPGLVGARLHAQFFWFGAPTGPSCPPLGWSASNALEITVQLP
jgi:hypothetical protein